MASPGDHVASRAPGRGVAAAGRRIAAAGTWHPTDAASRAACDAVANDGRERGIRATRHGAACDAVANYGRKRRAAADRHGRACPGRLEAIPDVPEVRYAVGMLAREAGVAAEIDGPGSEAAERFRLLAKMVDRGHQHLFDHRRQRIEPPSNTHPAADLPLEALQQAAAADLLAAAPPGEPVFSFPPAGWESEGWDSGRGRILFRIGVREASWIGSFERGEVKKNTVRVLPDRKHLFVCAEGAGYVIELKSRTLVHTTGTQITGVMYDDPMTLFVVNHNGRSMEAFGRTGRLWKTDTIGCGEFRGMALTDDTIVGEARQPFPPGWARFSVKLTTGEVRVAGGGGA
ncbi:MAG: hypothetical protein JWO56_105 [Acidobacteria bacterium]|nr:hypothetical protein [Acidobacteriota bacterium]